MKLASFILKKRRSFGIVEGGRIFDMDGRLPSSEDDLRGALAGGMDEIAKRKSDAPSYALEEIDEWLPVIPNPDKILCIGLNYDTHRKETGRPVAQYPTIFLRLNNTQTGHRTSLLRPKVTQEFDYEGELGFGPWMVTDDEIGDVTSLTLKTSLNGLILQEARISEMIFGIPRLIAYCSSFTPLETGDVICTGTPGGVGFTRTPPVFMTDGDRIEVEIEKVGLLSNGVEDEA